MGRMHFRLSQQHGQAMIIALAFTVLAVPIAVSMLTLASTLILDDRQQTRILHEQYAGFGGEEYALFGLVKKLTATTTLIYLNGVPVTSTVAKLIDPPSGEIPLSPRSQGRPFTSKVASPTSVAPNGTTTYVVTVENKHDKAVNINTIIDDLPFGFSYTASSTLMRDSSGVLISSVEPTHGTQSSTSTDPLSVDTLTWNTPQGTKLGPLELMTLEFQSRASPTDGLYCNEAFVEPGGDKTRSGKTAQVTVGSSTSTLCAGPVLSVTKTVQPEIVFNETEVTYDYRIELVNEGTDVIYIKEITDWIREDIGFVEDSVTSTPEAMHPGDPKFKNQIRDGVRYDGLEWRFQQQHIVEIDPGTSWIIEYKSTATLPRGFYGSDVEIIFDSGQLPNRVVPEVAVITVVDVYRITVTVGGYVYECNVWMTDDIYVGEFHVVDGCALISAP